MAKDSASGVRVMSRSIVKASVTRPRVVVPVSNLDLLYQDVPVSLLCVYRKPSIGSGDFQFQDVVAAFKTKLPSLLDYFPPLAGRIVANPRSGLPELDCDNQGAEVILCEVGEELGSLHYGDLEASLARIGVPVQCGADVALSLQLVSFACGGFAVVWGSNHVFLDGCALCMIITAWSELAVAGKISAAPPNHDRSVFRPRAPPAYDSSIGELFALASLENTLRALETSFVGRTYYLEERDLVMLRAQAGGPDPNRIPSRLEAVSAYLWKVFATAVGSSDERCRMAWWVNGRRHLTTTAPAEAMRDYFGNVTSYAVAEASVEGIKRQPLPEIACMMRESIKSTATDEHFQQLVDWVEDHKGKQGGAAKYVEAATVGLGSPLLGLTSFASFRFNTDFGFGQAAYAMPIWEDNLRLCCGCGVVTVTTSPDGSCLFFSMSISPRLAAALDSDEQRIFKPLTAEYLRLA
ncbi:hypothetical protein ACQ4PT_057179 [Festuca glaucescens]